MSPDDVNRIRHMIDAAEAAAQFVSSRKREELERDRMLCFALVRAVEIFGEAASKVSPETRVTLGSVPWGKIVAMRNRLVHACFDIDPEIVWKAVTDEIPPLIPALTAALPKV